MTITHLTLAEMTNMNDDSWVWKDDMITFLPAGWDTVDTDNGEDDDYHPIAECFAEANSDDLSDD